MPKRMLTEAEAAEYLGVSRSFLKTSRCMGPKSLARKMTDPPPWVKYGQKAIRYDLEDLSVWLAHHRVALDSRSDRLCSAGR